MASQLIHITFPDGTRKQVPAGCTVREALTPEGGRLDAKILAAKVSGVPTDLFLPLNQDATVEPLTFESSEGREVYRHSSTHIMAQAVKEVFPTAQLTIGPALDDGFYYDFAFDRPFTPEDLEKIEARAIEITKRGLTVTRSELSKQDAIKFFQDRGEAYKVELINSFDDTSAISLYRPRVAASAASWPSAGRRAAGSRPARRRATLGRARCRVGRDDPRGRLAGGRRDADAGPRDGHPRRRSCPASQQGAPRLHRVRGAPARQPPSGAAVRGARPRRRHPAAGRRRRSWRSSRRWPVARSRSSATRRCSCSTPPNLVSRSPPADLVRVRAGAGRPRGAWVRAAGPAGSPAASAWKPGLVRSARRDRRRAARRPRAVRLTAGRGPSRLPSRGRRPRRRPARTESRLPATPTRRRARRGARRGRPRPATSSACGAISGPARRSSRRGSGPGSA